MGRDGRRLTAAHETIEALEAAEMSNADAILVADRTEMPSEASV